MDRELRILMLEDVAADAEMAEHELRNGGITFQSKRVETKGPFIKELNDFSPDLILSDYTLPHFDGLSALTIAKAQYPDVPFILVSGAIGEELAIKLLKTGATDYVLKSNLKRLVPAVNRALREAKERVERKQADEALQQRIDELERFHRLTVERELRMIELKKEINALLKQSGKEQKYESIE